MAYSNWGAFVYCNNERRKDKEDAGVFDAEEANLPSGLRIYFNLLKLNNSGELGDEFWYRHSHHAVLGDGPVRLACYKITPELWVLNEETPQQVDLDQYKIHDEDQESQDNDWYDTHDYKGEFEGYKFSCINYENNIVELILEEPNGNKWSSKCGFEYGAGFMD